jgi:transposase-like protein
MSRKSRAKPGSPFRCFNSSPEVIRLVVMMYVRFPLSLRNVEDLLFERSIDICHETVRFWWNRFGPMFAGDIRRQRVSRMRGFRHWNWHLDEMYVKLNGEMVYLWRAVDHEGEILESFVTKERDKAAALRFMKKALKRHGSPAMITTDGLRSYGAAMNELGRRERAMLRPSAARWFGKRPLVSAFDPNPTLASRNGESHLRDAVSTGDTHLSNSSWGKLCLVSDLLAHTGSRAMRRCIEVSHEQEDRRHRSDR